MLVQVPNASKLRVDLRLFAELIAAGVFTEKEGLPVLANQLTLLMTSDREEHNNLSIVLCFCRHCGDDYAGLVPRKFRLVSYPLFVVLLFYSFSRYFLVVIDFVIR